jgi:Ca2+-binding RTX toxin-like protein
VLRGGPHEDKLGAGVGNNRMFGGTEADYFIEGPGDDQIFGGAGLDAIDFAYLAGPVPVTVDLGAHVATGAGNDQLRSIRDVYGSVEDGDKLVGNRFDNYLGGLGGADVLRGRGGDDELWGHSGDDEVFGGPGSDKLSGYGGEDGDDSYFGKEGIDQISVADGVSGNDYVDGGGQTGDVCDADPGDDVVNCP